jgi:hypothetical protein
LYCSVYCCCIVLCTVSPPVCSCAFPISVQICRPLPVAVSKLSHHIKTQL